MALHIRIVGSEERATPTVSQAAVRWIVPVAPSLFADLLTPGSRFFEGPDVMAILISMAVYLYAVIDRDKQGIHDKLAATVVVADR